MDFGLKRIVLIDSYVEGMASELDVTGHTNISGGNGKGKTSFLRLIPIFYGESPRRLVMASGNGNYSFNEFYLPRTGSYLVFEYMSHGEPRMVVFCNRANEARHRHIFIDSAYREDLFMDVELGTIHPANALLTRLSTANIHYLNVDTTAQYRKVLLDGTVPKAYHFSMCPRNSRMSQLTPLFTGMFKRDAQFADLSKVIQEYAMEKLDEDSRKILKNFSPHRDHLTTTLVQYDAYQALEKMRAKAELLQSQLDEHRVARKKLSASVVAAKAKYTDLEIQIRNHDRDIETVNGQIEAKETTYRNEHADLGQLIRNIDDELGPKIAAKSRIERDYQSYKESDLPAWEERLANLDSKKSELTDLREQHKTLSDASEQLRKPIMDQIERGQKRADDRTKELVSKRERINADYQGQRNGLTSQHASEVRSQVLTHQSEWQVQQQAYNSADSQVSRLEERRANPQPSPGLVKQLELAQASFDEAQGAFDVAQEENTNADDAFRKARKHYEAVDQRFEKAREYAEGLETELQEVQGLIHGNEDSLIYFLNENRPGWEDTLGRILQPDILRKNLSPAIDEEYPDSRSLFGIHIDLSKLPEQELTPAELSSRCDELLRTLETAEKECTAAESDLNKANTRQKDAQTRQETAERELKKARIQLKSERETLGDIKLQVQQSVRDNTTRIESELAEARASHTKAEEALESLKKDQGKAVEALAESHSQALKEFDKEHNDRLSEIKDGIDAAERECAEDVARLNRQLEQVLSGAGIDPKELQSLAERIETLAKEIEKVQDKRVTIQSYQTFMKGEYASLDGLKAEISELEAAKRQHKAAQGQLTRTWEKVNSDLGAKVTQLKRAKDTDGSNLNAIQIRVLNMSDGLELLISENDSTLALYREMAPQKLIDEYVKWVQKEAELVKDLKKLGDEFATVFERYPGTPSTQYWHEAESDWDGTDERTITRAKAVVDYYQGGKHSIVHDSLVKGFGNLDQIDIYRQAMENFDKRIRRFNRELSQHMAQSLTFESLTSIDPTVSFELEELDYWKDIKALADGVRAWREDAGLNSMPNEDLVLTLRNYLETFEVSRANVSVEDLWRLIRFRFTIVENGKPKTITGNKDLSGDASVSSNGVTYLVLIVVFLGFVDMQRNQQPVHLTWALDELRAFDNDNKRALLELLARHNISLVTACPDMEDRELGMFHQVYKLEPYKGGLRFVRWTMPPRRSSSPTNPFLAAAAE